MSTETRDTIRFLPADDADHEGTLVTLPSSHTARVYKVSPEDGEQGTWIDKRFRKAAVAAGCSIIGLGEADETGGPGDESRLALICAAIEKVIDSEVAEDMDSTGRPKIAAVKKAAGFNLNKGDLDAAWAAFVAGLDD